jgi:hypothetical protein
MVADAASSVKLLGAPEVVQCRREFSDDPRPFTRPVIERMRIAINDVC